MPIDYFKVNHEYMPILSISCTILHSSWLQSYRNC